jgi:hypothetical protein
MSVLCPVARLTCTRRCGNFPPMEENKARRLVDGLRDRGVDAHLATLPEGAHAVRVPVGDGRQAIWGSDHAASLKAEIMLDGVLVGFVPTIPGSEAFSEPRIIEEIAATDYTRPIARRSTLPPPTAPLTREGGVFRRFRDGFRYG